MYIQPKQKSSDLSPIYGYIQELYHWRASNQFVTLQKTSLSFSFHMHRGRVVTCTGTIHITYHGQKPSLLSTQSRHLQFA